MLGVADCDHEPNNPYARLATPLVTTSSELQEAAAAAIVVARSCAPGAWRGDDEAACCWCSLNAHLD